MMIAGYIFFVLGSMISLVNFYLSFLRYPIYRLCGGRKDDYQYASGIPGFGSAFVLMGMALLFHVRWILISGLIIALLDTGGLHWFIGVMIFYALFKKRSKAASESMD